LRVSGQQELDMRVFRCFPNAAHQFEMPFSINLFVDCLK
jgi:hypothetical protein